MMRYASFIPEIALKILKAAFLNIFFLPDKGSNTTVRSRFS